MNKIDEFFKKGLYTSKSTMKSYRCHLNRFFEVNNCNPNDYFNNKRDYESDIINYWEYLNGNPPTSIQSAISVIKRFLIMFDKKTRDLEIWNTLRFRLKGSSPVSEEHVPDQTELKKILHYADIRTKALSFIALTTGMRIEEITKLLPEDLHLDETPARINIRANITKTKKRRTVFLTPEATELIREWMRTKKDYIKNSIKKSNFNYKMDMNNPHVFPYASNTLRRGWNQAITKAGFGEKDNQTQKKRLKMHFHTLRKFFRSYFGNSDLAEHLMGHSGYLSTYRKMNDKQLAQKYTEYMHNLLIYEREVDLTEVHEQLQEKDEQIIKLQEDMKILQLTLQSVQNQLDIEKIKNGKR